MINIFNRIILLLFILPFSRAGTAENIVAFTGARTKIAWQQHQGDNQDTHGTGSQFKLVGFDTDVGQEKVILGTVTNYTRPLISYHGTKVVYSNRVLRKVYVVNWDGSNKSEIAGGFASDVWYDKQTGYEWAYIRSGDGTSNNPIIRYRLDNSNVKETVWSATAEGHELIPWFQLSADGTRAASCFPWSDCGMAQYPFSSYTRFGGGCYTSMAPDNSYMMWIFDGQHRNVDIYDGNATHKAKVDVHTAPGIRGWEVYHPKWSNQVRFFTVNGPYTAGSTGSCPSNDCGNKIGSGGSTVEVFIGKLNSSFTRVEGWVKVTYNARGDFYPDVWIDPGTGIRANGDWLKGSKGLQVVSGPGGKVKIILGCRPEGVGRSGKLVIYNTAGKVIQQVYVRGSYFWVGTDRAGTVVSPGVYILRVETRGRVIRRKIHYIP